jgi:hypothetical protein
MREVNLQFDTVAPLSSPENLQFIIDRSSQPKAVVLETVSQMKSIIVAELEKLAEIVKQPAPTTESA